MLIRGFFLGILFAAPVGPIGLLCIRRALSHHPAIAIATGFGATLVDAVLAGLVSFGFLATFEVQETTATLLRLVSGLVLLGVAAHAWRAHPHAAPASLDVSGVARAFGSGFLLTATNPLSLIGVMAVISGLGPVGSHTDAALLMAGITLGSGAWWFSLTGFVLAFRHRLPPHFVHRINQGAAVMLGGFGLYALGSGFYALSTAFL